MDWGLRLVLEWEENKENRGIGMKKTGILTLHRANNFGAVLQNYALQQAIRKLGVECETVDFHIERIDKEYALFQECSIRHPRQWLKTRFWELLNYPQGFCSKRKYEAFRNEKLIISERGYCLENIADSNKVYDAFICGSDQIWNRYIIGEDNLSVFTLSFANKASASYAASCGNVEFLPTVELLKNIDYVTVREDELNEYMQKQSIDSKQVCDPCLLLNREDWMALFSYRKPRRKYVYLYYIDSGRDVAAKIAREIAKERKEQVIYSKKYDQVALKEHYGINRFSDGPIDFIERIAEADFVVVSSFHGVIFSIIFEKDFIALLHEQTGSRVTSLLTKLGLQDRIIRSWDEYVQSKIDLKSIDYTEVQKKLETMKAYSLRELEVICRQ